MLEGSFLVASPKLADRAFHRSVVYVMKHNQRGAFGVVLNRLADKKIKSAWNSIAGLNNLAQDNIRVGGPMGGPVFALHRDPTVAEAKVCDGLFLSAQRKLLQRLISRNASSYRIFFGATGWQNGQLENEIEDGLWYPMAGGAESVFLETDGHWETAIRAYGNCLFEDVVGIDASPGTSFLN